VFFQVTDPTGAQLSQNPWQDYSASDESGFVYERHGGYCSFAGTSNSMMFGLSLRAFPRRQSSFLFHLHGANQAVLATFRVPNPVRGPFPEWTPEPLPHTQSNGPVTLTLEAMSARGGSPPRVIVPRWQIESFDPAWAKARARYATLVDATGNEAQMLSPRENAWRLRTWVHRDQDEDFGVADRFSITNQPVPKAGEFHSLDQSAVRHGIELKVLVIAGPGELVVSNGVRSMFPPPTGSSGHSTSQSGTSFIERWPSQTHFLLLEAIGVDMNDEIRIRVFDSEGQRIKLIDSGYQGTRSGGRVYQRQFTPGQSAHSLALDIIVSRPVFFEFAVDPNDTQTFNP
jgi:hypothetical protein